jgi:acetyltransferase-like isoleucine patch superfamily enzyme
VTGLRDPDDPEFKTRYLPIVIDDFACIGARATILGGITIGTGAVVRAGSVVLEDVEPFAIVEGVPARVVGRRSLTDFSYRLTPGPLFG